MKKIKLLLLLLAGTFMLHAQLVVTVTGTIYDAQANPVPNHPVTVIDSASNTFFPPAIYNYVTDANGVYQDTITLGGQAGMLHFMTADSCGPKHASVAYNSSPGTNTFNIGFILCNNAAATNNFLISATVLTNNYQNFVPNYPVTVIDSATSAFGGVAIYNYLTDSSGQFTDSLTTVGTTGTLWFLAPDSCGFTTIALGYSPNSPSTLGTAGLVLCNNIVNSGSNCNYTVSALPVAGFPNQAFFSYSGQSGSTYLWDFGDGNTSTQASPFHTYAQPGTYYYCLTIDSCAPVCDSITVFNQGGGCDPFFFPVVNGSTVDVFPSLLTGQFVAIVDWGDGVVDTFTPANIPVLPNNITHTYATPGNYQICLTHSNTSLGCSNTYCDSVNVGANTPLQCNAEFIIDTVNSQPGTVVVWNTSNIVGGSPNANVNFLWDFGDGNTSTNPFPTHNYQSAGSYSLCLTITAFDSTGFGPITCTSTYCDSLTVDQNGNIVYKGSIIGWTLNVIDPSTIGIEEDVFEGFNIYPNPATSFMVIDVPDQAENVSMELINMTGQQMRKEILTAGSQHQVDINDLAAGIYFVRIQSNENAKTYKLIKQ